MKEISYRPLAEKELLFLTDLLNRKEIIDSLHTIARGYEEWLHYYRDFWQHDPDERNFVIFHEELPVGWLKLNGLEDGKIGWISMLVILPEWQGKGIGRNAVTFSEDFFRKNRLIQCGIQITADNQKARALYSGCGYQVQEEKDTQSEDGISRKAVVFQKRL